MSKRDEREMAEAIVRRWQRLDEDARARADGEMLAIELTQEEIDHVFERRVKDLLSETFLQPEDGHFNVGSDDYVRFVVARHRVEQMEPHVTQATRERLKADFESALWDLDDDD